MFCVHSLSVAGPADLTDITFRPVDNSRYPEILELLYANFHTGKQVKCLGIILR